MEGQHTAYRMSAPSREEMHAWISAIQRSINKDQSIEEVLERRSRAASGHSRAGGDYQRRMDWFWGGKKQQKQLTLAETMIYL